MKGIRLIPYGTTFDFWRHRWMGYAISLIVVFASIGLLATKGLNFGIDFTGGTLIEIRTEQVADLGQMRSDLNALGLGDISIQEFGAPEDLLLRVPEQPGDETAQTAAIASVRAALDAEYSPIDYRRVEFVGPQVGEELKSKGIWATVLAMLGIAIYIWFRFEWQFGVGALAALFHDIIAILGFFALTGLTFDLAALAAVLTVAGYSVNDTVVIFDRIRDTMRKYRKQPMVEIVNRAINDTLARTVVTGLTTLLALAALAVFGGEVLRGFVLSIMVGVVIGTHSSIFVAALLLMYLKVRPEHAFNKTEETAASS
jgi:preprotein translocase subunit SecF